ncbi:MAG TPA: hypothetical protein VJ797_04205 [Burkholderiales bacterium]|nr:hypothetical protein [Burkholderiales bacterium]
MAALPLLFTGAGYALSTRPEGWLIELMLVERVVLATTLVMLILGWFFRGGTGRLEGFVVCALVFTVTSAAMSYGGSESSLLVFMLLTVVTYSGLALNWNSGNFWFQFLVRWVLSTAVFWLALSYASVPRDLRQWPGHASVIEAGAIYFLVLAGVELSGFYQRWLPGFARRAADGFRKTG